MRKFKTNLFLLGLCATLGFGVVACDGDNEKENDPKPTPGQTENPGGTNNGGNNDQTPGTPGGEAPVFPEVTTLAGKAGDTLTLSFGANLDWELTTNALWCQFNNGLFDLSGEKGEQEIKVAITDANQGFDVDSANITLLMGGESQIIAKVFRAALNYEVKVKPFGGEEDVEYSNENPIIIDSYASIDIEVNTNFAWGVSTTAEWLEVTKSENIVTLTVKDGYTQNAINNSNDVICINTETATIVTIPVSYLGMDPMAITINPSTKWNMQISADGKSYSESSMSDGAVVTNAAPYTAKLTALNNEYTLVSYKYNEWGLAIFQPEMGDTPWFTVEDDKAGNISVSFNENTTKKERQGYLFALPNAKYNEIKDNPDGFFIEDMNAEVWEVSVAAERYTVAHFVQMTPATEGSEGGVTAKYTTGNMDKIPVQMLSADNNPEIYEFICSEYGVTSVAYAIVEPTTPFQIFTTVNGWEGELSAFVMGKNKDFAPEWGFEPGMDSNEKMYCQCYGIGNEAIGTYAFIAFKKNGINQQVLVIDLTEYVAPEKDLEVLDVMAGSAIPSAKADSESEIYMYISSEYSVQSVFTTNLDPKANIFVNPTTEFDNIKVFVNGSDKSTEWSVEAMELMGNMGVLLSVPADAANSTAHVVFYSNQIAKEVLYITVKGAERATEVEIFPSNVWNITISQDGSTYKNMFDTPYTATVSAENNDYVLVEYTYDSQYGLTQVQEWTPAWFNTENDGQGNIIVTFPANSGEERKGYLFAVPGAKYEEIKNNLDGFFVEDMNAAIWEVSVAAEKYVVGEFIQEGIAAEAKDLTLTNALSYMPIEVKKLSEMDGDYYWFLTGEYGAQSAYMATSAAASIIINPGCEFDDVVINQFGQSENLVGQWSEMSMNMQGDMVLNIFPTEECQGKDFIIAFKANYMTQVALYLSIPGEDSGDDNEPGQDEERATEVEISPSNVWNIAIPMAGAEYGADVTAKNNDYVLIEYTYTSDYGLTQVQEWTPAWFQTEDDGQGNITVTFPENSGEERKGYLFAVPGAKYEEIKNDLDGFFVEDMNAAIWEVSVAAEKYVVGEFIQEGIAAEAKGMTIKAGIQSIDVTTLTEMHEDLYYYLTGEFGAEKAYMAMTSMPFMTITPGVDFDDVVIYEMGSTENIASSDICEPTMDYEDNMALMFYPSEEMMGKEFIILFKSNYVTKAGLYFFFGE